MKRWITKYVIVLSLAAVLFFIVQALWGRPHLSDFGETYGFPLHYMQDGGFIGKGHVLWGGLSVDIGLMVLTSLLGYWIYQNIMQRR